MRTYAEALELFEKAGNKSSGILILKRYDGKLQVLTYGSMTGPEQAGLMHVADLAISWEMAKEAMK